MQQRLGSRLEIDALTLITRLHLLWLCRLAVRVARRRCPPPLPAGPGGRPRRYREDSLLLLALLRTLWRFSYQDLHDWLVAWPALAVACGLPVDAAGHPCVPSAAQQCRRAAQAGAPAGETLFVLLVQLALQLRLIGGRDLIVDSAPILAWRRRDPDAALGHAPHHHARPLLWGYRVHTLLCRGSGLPLLAFVAPANGHDAPFAQPLLTTAGHCRPALSAAAARHPPGCRLLGPQADRLDPHDAGGGRCHPLESQAPAHPLLSAAQLDGG